MTKKRAITLAALGTFLLVFIAVIVVWVLLQSESESFDRIKAEESRPKFKAGYIKAN